MPTTRRLFLQSAAAAAVTAAAGVDAVAAETASTKRVTRAELDRILDQPVLKTDFLTSPVTVASIELLRNGQTFMVRARSSDGAESITVPNSNRVAMALRASVTLSTHRMLAPECE